MKIVTILGARPQFIKAGSVSREISKHKGVEEIIVHTGQHFDENMSDVFFNEMHIPKPHYSLGVNGLGHGAMTGQMLEQIEQILIKEEPDWVLVYGDTNSTLAGAIAASKLHIKIAHVEAGLRSFNMNMPEEVNRILTDRVSTLLFCPTEVAVSNLKTEGYENFGCTIIKSGDVMQDGAMFYMELGEDIGLIEDDYILTTVHRAENTDDVGRLKSLVDALNEIAKEMKIVLPLHPRTKKALERNNLYLDKKIDIMAPVGYLKMVSLIKNAKMVMTDSGGLQKEAFFFKKPCITLRDETEWTELIEHGFNTLVGTDKEKIISAVQSMQYDQDFNIDLYGMGKASEVIVSELISRNKIR